jgi:hypothetical protein
MEKIKVREEQQRKTSEEKAKLRGAMKNNPLKKKSKK